MDLSVLQPLPAFSDFRSILDELGSDVSGQPVLSKVLFEKSHWG